ncbi:hypothetical protein HDU98_002921 [Podochytrium sp. JEL0797]|nr:hypothetical protein HDU98_002921 [Podochytrium sp. JEL0797]
MKLLALTTLATTSLAQSCTTFGAYQCSGSTLQQCAYGTSYDLNWVPMETCSSGTTCTTEGYVGCMPDAAPAGMGVPDVTSATFSDTSEALNTDARTLIPAPAVTAFAAATSNSAAPVAPPSVAINPSNSVAPVPGPKTEAAPPPAVPQATLIIPIATPIANTSTDTTLPDCYPNWTATPFANIPYNTANLVSYAGNNYIVAYQGAAGPPAAGGGTGWTLQGPCGGSGFTFRPFTTPGVIGYWTQWSPYTRKQNSIDKIDLTGFTAINYAFVNVDATGALQSFDTNADLNWMRIFTAQRIKYPNLKAIVSIGGWSGSQHFSTVAASASLTQAFVKNVHTFLDTMGFDGVDLDWEYPGGSGITCNTVSTSDAANYANLLSALRTELGPTRSISIAVSAITSHYADPATGVSYIPQYMKSINYAQIMSYDFYGSWDAYSDFNSPLNSPGPSDPQQPSQNNAAYPVPLSQSAAVALWVKAGASPSKLTNGLAFYGRSWTVPSTTNNGLYQLCQGSTKDAVTGLNSACAGPVGDVLDVTQFCDPCKLCYNSGVWMYLNLRGAAGQTMPPLPSSPVEAGNGWTREYFEFAQSPTVQTASNFRGLPSFISYDDPVSIKAKAAWAKSSGLGGTMIWELSQDYNAELVTAVHAGWGA